MRAFHIAWFFAIAGIATAQELWHFGKPNLVYGIYRKIADPNNPRNYYENRIGHIDTKVTDTELNGVQCRKYDSTAYFSPKPNEPPQPRMRHYETWIDAKGNILKVNATYSAWRKGIAAEGIFTKDSIELRVNEGRETKKTTLYPASGVESFRNPLQDIAKTAEKDRKEVSFCAFDVSTAGILNYTAKVIGKWNARFTHDTYQGVIIQVEGKLDGKMKFYVSDTGDLFQIDLGDGAKVYSQTFDVFPDGEVKRLKDPP